jgi:pectate lyase
VLYILLSINPSIAFLWAVILETVYYMRTNELDRTFDSIIRDVEEELEDEMDGDGISVAFVDDKAYWVLDNTFYQADIIDGVIDKETSRPIDASNMSYGDMNKMLFILDHLNEG